MDIKEFLENVKNVFDEDETDITSIRETTVFKEVEGWSSLVALSLIAMVDDEYEVVLKGDDVKSANTIVDLFEIIKDRK